MGRDGLIEQNRATGEEKRVSQRAADMSFDRARPADLEAGHHLGKRESTDSGTKKRRKQPRPIQQTAEEAAWASAPEPVQPYMPEPVETYVPDQNTPSMRMAVDAPMMAASPVSEPEPPSLPDKRKRKKRLGRKAKKKQSAKFAAKAASLSAMQELEAISPVAAQKSEAVSFRGTGNMPLRKRMDEKSSDTPAKRKPYRMESGERLHFEEAERTDTRIPASKSAKKKAKQRQIRRFVSDEAKPIEADKFAESSENAESKIGEWKDTESKADEWKVTQPKADADRGKAAEPEANEQYTSVCADVSEQRHFETRKNVHSIPHSDDARKKYKQLQAMRFANTAIQARASAPERSADTSFTAYEQKQGVSAEYSEPEQHSQPVDAAFQSTNHDASQQFYKDAQNEEIVRSDTTENSTNEQLGRQNRRLQFEDEQRRASAASESKPEPEKDDVSYQNRRYERAAQRVEKAEKRVEKAREKLPTKRRLTVEQEFGSETGKPRRRLHFETEIQPEYEKPSLPARAGQMVRTTALMKLHSKIHESERENVSVEATHKGELMAEQAAGRFLRWNKTQRRSQPYRALRNAERQVAKEKANLAWQAALRDHPELQKKHAFAKWVQKQQIKRKYAQAAHETKQAAQFTQNILTSTGQIVRAVAQQVAAKKSMLLIVAFLALIVVFFSAGLTSCTAMLSGIQSSYISTAYMANEEDICDADLYYTELETDLQLDINKTEENYPGYDEYRYNIGEISHNPYELLGYLSTMFNAFTFDEIKDEIEQLFNEQYTLTREAVPGTNGSVLQTTLTVKPLFDVIREHLPAGEETDRYDVYMQTLGNRQAFGNPFDFAWLGSVTSGYGYRIHPTTGEKDLHRGIDIAAAQGTAIKAIQDGTVTSAGDAGSYGLCVTIADDQVYESRYAHCSSLAVSTGQEVKRGDVIGAVGSTGESTGPHLHLEVLLNGEYLNPYFFVDTGDDGTGSGAIPGSPGGPEIPDYSGSPVGDGTFAAMLEEAEKYLGWPYVWGGSSPATSFDCSGYVCWVLNQSGAMSIERTTATGIYNRCTPIPKSEAQPGDLIFFTRTYSSPGPISHIGIYVGDGKFIHCGNPISYASVNNSYWQEHFYAYARIL